MNLLHIGIAIIGLGVCAVGAAISVLLCGALAPDAQGRGHAGRKTTSPSEVTAMIRINLDVMLAKRKMSLTELAEKVGITLANLSVLKTGKAKAVRFSTLDALCRALACQPGDILEFTEEESDG